MISFKGRHFPKDIILMEVRWKIAHPLSYRAIEELMEERGADLDHSTVQKWVVHYAPGTKDRAVKCQNQPFFCCLIQANSWLWVCVKEKNFCLLIHSISSSKTFLTY